MTITIERAPRVGTRQYPREIWSVDQFRLWLQKAQRGEWCRYFLGHLSAAREGVGTEGMDNRSAWALTKLADDLATAAYYAQRAGLVALVQKRTRLMGYQYLAVKR
jgi:hypothetical protein